MPSSAVSALSFSLTITILGLRRPLRREGRPSLRESSAEEASPSSPSEEDVSRRSSARLDLLRSALHDLLHVVTSSQLSSHFLRHVNGRLHTTHVLKGRL